MTCCCCCCCRDGEEGVAIKAADAIADSDVLDKSEPEGCLNPESNIWIQRDKKLSR